MLWQTCLVLIFVYAMILRWKNRELRKIAKQLPTKLKPVPILEHAVYLIGTGQERMKGFQRMGEEAIANSNGLSSIWFGNKLYVVVVDPEAAEVIMKECLEKDDMMNITRALLGNGSVFAPVSIWRRRRKLITPHFGQKTLDSFVNIFSHQASVLVDQLIAAVGKSKISIVEYVSKYAMDTICETALGTKMNTLTLPSHPVLSAFDEFIRLAGARIVNPWQHPDFIYRWSSSYPQFEKTSSLVKDFAAKIVEKKQQEIRANNLSSKLECGKHLITDQENNKTKSFLELLIEENRCSALEVQEESLVLLLAATHSTSSTFSFLALELANNPHIQEKVYQEIKEVFGDLNRPIQPEELPKLTYLDAVIKETLRLYPPFPVITRKIDKKVTLPSGITLLPGMGVIFHIWSTHRNPKYWGPDVNVFRPERFFEGPLEHPYAYMPFSHGPRNCVAEVGLLLCQSAQAGPKVWGLKSLLKPNRDFESMFDLSKFAVLSLKTVIAHFFSRYRVLPVTAPGKVRRDEEMRVELNAVLQHVDNFEVRLELRN